MGMTTKTIHPMRGPRQAGRVERWLGFATAADRRAAREAVAQDPAAWDALRPACVIDVSAAGYEPVRGSSADCEALYRAI